MISLPWYVFALSAAFILAVVAVLEKKTLANESPLHFSFAVTVVGGLLSTPFLFFIPWEALSLSELLVLVAATCANVTGFWLVAKATKVLEASEVSVLLSTTPAAIALFGFLFLGEMLSAEQTLGILFIVLGLMVLELPHLFQTLRRKKLREFVFVGIVGIAIVIYAASSVIDRVVLTTFGITPFHFIVFVQAMSMVVFALIELVASRGSLLAFGPFLRSPVKVLAVALLLSLSRVMYAQAVSLVYAALAASVKRTGALFTVLLSGALLKEQGLIRKLAAVLLIIAGAITLI